MKTIRITLTVLVLGAMLTAGAYFIGKRNGAATYVDVNTFMVAIRNGVKASQEHEGFVWYRVCPSRLGGYREPPKIMMTYPIQYEFAAPLDRATFTQSADHRLRILMPPIEVRYASAVETNLEYQESGGLWVQGAKDYVDAERKRVPIIVKYLAFDELRAKIDSVRATLAQEIKMLGFFHFTGGKELLPSVEVEWDEPAQQAYFKRMQAELTPPPFGAEGCTRDWFRLNGRVVKSLSIPGKNPLEKTSIFAYPWLVVGDSK